MKRYLLLRDNLESGPYSVEELSAMGLKPFDLIWINDNSGQWQYPTEIDELKEYVCQEGETPKKSGAFKRKIFVSLPADKQMPATGIEEAIPLSAPPVEPDTVINRMNELPRGIQKIELWPKKIFIPRNGLRVAAVFFGLVIGAIIIKKVVDNSVETPTAQMYETVTPGNIIQEQIAGQNFQNALTTEVVVPEKETVKPPVPKPMKPKDIRKMVKVSSNEYTKGLFGGIENLQLTVSNGSPHTVDKVTVEIDYLKPNGDVIKTENIYVEQLKPNSSKIVKAPASNRGVKVNVKVLNIYSQQYREILKQI